MLRSFFLLFSLVFFRSAAASVATSTKKEMKQKTTIPHFDQWRHRPVFLKASEDTKVSGIADNETLPLGVPFEFETPLFKGRMLVRLRHANSDDSEKHENYFSGRKRIMQTVVQGKFKKPVSMAELYVGSVFREPIRLVPPPSVLGLMQALISRTAPGVLLDLASKQPKVVNLFAGSAQTMSIDVPGEEPDMTAVEIPENLGNRLGKVFKSTKHRKRVLSTPKKAERYQFDTEHVYTLHTYDDTMDYGNYTMKIPMYGDYDLSKAIGPQPMTLSAMTTSGETVFHFDVWHESVYRSKFLQ